MHDWINEDKADRIGITVFCLLILGYALFGIGLFLCAMKLFWWVLFVL